MILEQKRKLASLYNTIKELKEAGKQSEQAYLDAFQEMTKTFEIVKDLERQKAQLGDHLIQEEKLNPESLPIQVEAPVKAQMSEN
jgi:hypothetical protein